MPGGNKLVTGVIGEDCHIVGNKLLVRALREAGFQVASLGIRVSPEEFIAAAIETDADAILVSSISGHGELHCRSFRDKCVEAGIGDILLYAGGHLVVGDAPWDRVERTFLDMGFTRVYPPWANLEKAVEDLRTDISNRQREVLS